MAEEEKTTEEEMPVAEPVAEETPAAEQEAATPEPEPEAPSEQPAAGAELQTEGEAPSAQPEPKKTKKRLPRALRPQRTRPKREPSATRKAISREPKPEHERGRRQERRGVVVSAAMDKTIVVKVDQVKAHRKYKKVIRRSAKFHAHDEQNEAKAGDVVRIVETRPISATKNWRLAEILEVAK